MAKRKRDSAEVAGQPREGAQAAEEAAERDARMALRVRVLISKLLKHGVPEDDAALWTIALNPNTRNARHNSYTYTHPAVGTFTSRTSAKLAHQAHPARFD